MQDQLVVFMALASGKSRLVCSEPSLHTRTAMMVAELLLPSARFSVRRLAPGMAGGGRAGRGAGPEPEAGAGRMRAGAGAGPEQEAGGGRKTWGGLPSGQCQGGGLYMVECEGACVTAAGWLEAGEGRG